VPIDRSQLGRAGELALSLYALVGSGGAVELFSPVVDDDHVDLVAGPRGGLPELGLQVKTSDGVDANGLVEAAARFAPGGVREDARFVYAVVLLDAVRIRTLWMVPSADFNRLVYRAASGGAEVLEFRARPEGDDRFSEFRVEPLAVGKWLRARFAPVAERAPQWLAVLGRRHGG
jgi:hypothetical protein